MLFSSRFSNYLANPSGPAQRTGNTFTDISGSISSAQKKFGTYSINGFEAGRFTTTGHNDSKFTLEGWFRFSSISSSYRILFGGYNTSFALGLYDSNIMTLAQTNGTNQDFLLGISLALNTWYHVALTKDGTSVKLFINGTQRGGTKTFAGAFLNSGDTLRIGAGTLGQTMDGYVDEVRLSNSIRYDGNGIEPTAAFVNDDNTVILCHAEAYPLVDDTTVYDTPTADPYYSSVVYLARFDDNLIDQKGVTTGVTKSGSAALTQAQSKFGGWSLNKPSGSSFLTLAAANNTQFAMGTGDFTVEYWIRFTNNPANNNNFGGLCLNRQANGTPGGSWSIYQGSTSLATWSVGWYDGNVGFFQSHTNRLTAGTWYHVAYSRVSGTIYIAVNGVVENKGTMSRSIATAGGSQLGTNHYNEYNFAAHYDEVRVTKGVGRYTSNFTAPTTRFPNY